MLGTVGKLLTGTVRYGAVLKVDRAEGLKYLNCKKEQLKLKKRGNKKVSFFVFPFCPSLFFFLSFPTLFFLFPLGIMTSQPTYSTDLLFSY